MVSQLPIIYVRGFAGSASGIDSAVDDPFYGFNAGATHIRVGREGLPRFYQFEGPLLRLMIEHGYRLRVDGGQQEHLQRAEPNSIEPDTVWVYRFYDSAASTFGQEPQGFRIERAARGLGEFIEQVLEKTRDADRVYLVAHSMGGLICRSLIQAHLERPHAKVSKVVTYGTPHGGIEVELGGPIGEWVMETFGPNGSDIFRPGRMYEYLSPDGALPRPADWDPRSLGEADFPPERFLCLVGTNAADYDVAAGWSSRAIGVKSDGLVQIRNAYVKGANRAYIHRSHSGRYGMVNSEEGYQNLQRFLFGSLKVETGLWRLQLDTSGGQTWQADVRLAIRGVPVLMHEQTAEHHCPVQLLEEARQHDTADSPIPLVTTYLLADRTKQGYARYALSMRVIALKEASGFFLFTDHLEQIADWEDTLIIDVHIGDDGLVSDAWWEWNSRLSGRIADADRMPNGLTWTQRTIPPDTQEWTTTLPITDAGRVVLGPEAEIGLAISPWS